MRPGRILAGLVLLGLGGLLLADRLSESVRAGAILADWWPVLLVAVGVLQLLHSPRSVFASTLVIVLGLLLLAGNLGVAPGLDLGIAWPAALILLGVRLVYRGMAGRALAWAGETATVDALVLFRERDITGGEGFRGGWVTAIFGGATIDLLHARPAPEGARLTVSAVFGGVDVLVPEGWRVRVSGFPILGGVSDATRAGSRGPSDEPSSDPRATDLIVDATAVLGRVEVRHGSQRDRTGKAPRPTP